MAYPPGPEEFKAQFSRDFQFGSSADKVTDPDVTRALTEAAPFINTSLYSQAIATLAMFYCAAHFLVTNLDAVGGPSARNLGRGLRAQGGGVIQNKSVDGVSVAYQWPESIVQSRILGQFTRTEYGNRFLQYVTPYLVGNFAVVAGPNADQQDSLDGGNPK